jgi:hypothetical protein
MRTARTLPTQPQFCLLPSAETMAERYHIFHFWNSTVVLPFLPPLTRAQNSRSSSAARSYPPGTPKTLQKTPSSGLPLGSNRRAPPKFLPTRPPQPPCHHLPSRALSYRSGWPSSSCHALRPPAPPSNPVDRLGVAADSGRPRRLRQEQKTPQLGPPYASFYGLKISPCNRKIAGRVTHFSLPSRGAVPRVWFATLAYSNLVSRPAESFQNGTRSFDCSRGLGIPARLIHSEGFCRGKRGRLPNPLA